MVCAVVRVEHSKYSIDCTVLCKHCTTQYSRWVPKTDSVHECIFACRLYFPSYSTTSLKPHGMKGLHADCTSDTITPVWAHSAMCLRGAVQCSTLPAAPYLAVLLACAHPSQVLHAAAKSHYRRHQRCQSLGFTRGFLYQIPLNTLTCKLWDLPATCSQTGNRQRIWAGMCECLALPQFCVCGCKAMINMYKLIAATLQIISKLMRGALKDRE